MSGLTVPPGWDTAEVNRWIRYHSEISFALTQQRTALESALIPVTAYILVGCVEAYRRYPELMTEIAAAVPPEELGRAGRRPGSQIDTVRLWSIANFPLVGRSVLVGAGLLDWEADVGRMATVLDFWRRAAGAWRGDGHLQAWDADGHVTPYDGLVPEVLAGCEPLADEEGRARMTRLNALLTSYLFLLWFDTRSGYQDSGPYRLPDGRVLLLRTFNALGPSHLPWSAQVGADLPFHDVLGAFVLDGVDLRVTDFGTAVTDPADYLARVQAFGLFRIDPSGALTPVDAAGVDALAAAAKDAQRRCYRMIAGMERRAKIDAGAYVYFSFLRPFALAAGIDDRLDWTVPRDSLDLYPLLELIDTTPAIEGDGSTYYAPIP